MIPVFGPGICSGRYDQRGDGFIAIETPLCTQAEPGAPKPVAFKTLFDEPTALVVFWKTVGALMFPNSTCAPLV
jgi:hypothetical protein